MNTERPRIRFVPARLKVRHDGWTPARQVRFIDELAATRSITSACRAVGMSSASAYKLRGRPEAAGFAHAWRQALSDGTKEGMRLSRAGARRRLKVSELHEVHGPPDSSSGSTRTSSASETLETLLEVLRVRYPSADGSGVTRNESA